MPLTKSEQSTAPDFLVTRWLWTALGLRRMVNQIKYSQKPKGERLTRHLLRLSHRLLDGISPVHLVPPAVQIVIVTILETPWYLPWVYHTQDETSMLCGIKTGVHLLRSHTHTEAAKANVTISRRDQYHRIKTEHVPTHPPQQPWEHERLVLGGVSVELWGERGNEFRALNSRAFLLRTHH